VRWRDRVLADVPGARLLAPDAMHVTLCFLDGQAASAIQPIAEACESVRDSPTPELELSHPIWLSPRRPRVIAVELRDLEHRLTDAQARLSDLLAHGGWYAPEKRPFLAHVTVARFGRGKSVTPRELAPPPAVRFEAPQVTLFRSHMHRAGASYEPLATVALGSAQ
jgi:2'-5' RNA ligase